MSGHLWAFELCQGYLGSPVVMTVKARYPLAPASSRPALICARQAGQWWNAIHLAPESAQGSYKIQVLAEQSGRSPKVASSQCWSDTTRNSPRWRSGGSISMAAFSLP